MEVLILRLDGPLMSFGDVAVDEIRPTARLPGRSMLTGLLGNALGLDHRDVDALDRLQSRLRFAARLDRKGAGLRDYQTAEIGKDDLAWTSRGVPAGRAGGPGSYVGPTLRQRYYRADSVVTLALTLEPAEETPALGTFEAALRRPERPLFIGRKGCPPAGPLLAGRIEARNLVEALERTPVLRADRADVAEIETEDDPREPDAERTVAVADRRDWRLGLHAGESLRRNLHRPLGEGAP